MLLLSPFTYRVGSGTASFANVYEDGGVYDDGLCGGYVVGPPCGARLTASSRNIAMELSRLHPNA